jgi:pimeloyl-ACP methyl ester carboxylesterase
MPAQRPPPGERRAPNGIFYTTAGLGEPLLLLHGLMVSGAMFDPLVALLQSDFRIIVPDLRGHGRSGELPGPYDVPALAADLDAVLEHAGVQRCAVLGYSHGGAVAQQLALTRPAAIDRLLLACTYACNVATAQERAEASVLLALLSVLPPRALGGLVVRASRPRPDGEIGLDKAQAAWLRALMAANHRAQMREAARGLISFDSRPWLKDIRASTLVVGGTHDAGVPRHHFEMLLRGIPAARGRLVERAGHTLIWTHTGELADIVQTEWPLSSPSSRV